METIKIAYADFWPEWEQENFIEPILRKYFNVEIDQNNPDVLFHSVFGTSSLKWKCKKILFLAENIHNMTYNPEIQNAIRSIAKEAYATIGFDPHSERNFRLPLWQVYWLLWPDLKERLFNRVHHPLFERFCSFTVSNPSNTSRNSAFDKLHSYKKVHSYGKVRTNDLSLIRETEGKYWREAKSAFFYKHPHKFTLTYENTSYPYYCTEKLMDGFLAGSIPIYWGDPKVWDDWNKDAFINAQKIGLGWIDIVKQIDNDQSLFNDMYNQPVFTDEQKKRHLYNLSYFEDWLIKAIKS